MLTLLIAILFAAAGVLAGVFLIGSVGWAITLGVVGFAVPAAALSFWLRKRLERIFTEVQTGIQHEQEQIQRQVLRMQNKVSGSTKGLQQQMEKKQAEGIRRALQDLDRAKPLFKWNFLARRQVNTLKAQLYYQIKDFEKADEFLKDSIALDPMTVAIRMARNYKHGNMEAVEKDFKKHSRRFKYDKGTLLYALYSWILVKENRIDEAVELLAKAKEETEDETLAANWEHLANGRTKRFSNAGLGEQWYALHLETPKAQRPRARGGRRRFR